jgi:hypothetical protein
MGNYNKQCCATDALRRIRQIPINGIPTGICIPDECSADLKTQYFIGKTEILPGTPRTGESIPLHSLGSRGGVRTCAA